MSIDVHTQRCSQHFPLKIANAQCPGGSSDETIGALPLSLTNLGHATNISCRSYIYIYTSRFKGVPFQFQKLSFLRGAVSTPLSIHEDGAPEKHDFQSQTQGIFLTMVPQESKALPKTFALCFPKKCFSKQNVKFVCVC